MSLISPLCLPERLILKYPSKQAERNLLVVLSALSISVRICVCLSPWGKGSSGSGRLVVQGELVAGVVGIWLWRFVW